MTPRPAPYPGAGTPRRAVGRVAGAVLLPALAASLLTGCEAGRNAATIQADSVIDGVNGDAGTALVRYARVVQPEGVVIPQSSTAQLRAVLVNAASTADALLDVTTPVAGSAQISVEDVQVTASATGRPSAAPTGSAPSSAAGTPTATAGAGSTGRVDMPPNGPTPGEVVVTLSQLTRDLPTGLTIPVTFVFERGGTVTLDVPVQGPTVPIPRPTPAGPVGGEEG